MTLSLQPQRVHSAGQICNMFRLISDINMGGLQDWRTEQYMVWRILWCGSGNYLSIANTPRDMSCFYGCSNKGSIAWCEYAKEITSLTQGKLKQTPLWGNP